MSASLPENAADLSMLELYRVESETQCAALSSGLVELERSAGSPAQLEALMRAAHSLKAHALKAHARPLTGKSPSGFTNSTAAIST